MTAAREAAYAALAAACETDGAAADASRAAGRAAATAHMADHELGPAYYAELVIHDMQLRSVKFRGAFHSAAPLK